MTCRIPAYVMFVLGLVMAGWAQVAPSSDSAQPAVTVAWAQDTNQYPPTYSPSRLSSEDQRKFDKYYEKWVDAGRKNDREDVDENARHMQDIMAHYNIPPSVPFAQIASNPGYGGYAGANTYGNPSYSRLSAEDQKKFDDYYRKWLDAGRKNDRDDIESNGRHMQEIMTRYNIPPSVPFDQVASGGYATGGYNNSNGVSAYPAYAPGRLSGDDQKKFDKYYKKWADARRKNDRDDIDENARHMEDIMAHYNIPANVPFDRIASPAAAYR